MPLSDKVLDTIGIILVALIGTAGGMWAWLTNRKKVAAEAKKALAEAEAAERQSDAEAEKTATEADVLANQAAFDTLLKSNTYLQDRLAKQDARIELLESEIRTIKAEREKLLVENTALCAQVSQITQKYEALQKWVIATLDALVSELGGREGETIDKAEVIAVIKRRLSTLPKTGPLANK